MAGLLRGTRRGPPQASAAAMFEETGKGSSPMGARGVLAAACAWVWIAVCAVCYVPGCAQGPGDRDDRATDADGGLSTQEQAHTSIDDDVQGAASCARDRGGCDPLRTCMDTDAGVGCGPCPAGYRDDGDRRCRDIDECADNNGGCDPLAECLNSPGTYECGPCPEGYRGHGSSGCDDVDECARVLEPVCPSLGLCTNTPGGYECGGCPPGFSEEAAGCVDINECALPESPCDVRARCENTPGGFRCGPCPAGYRTDGADGCVDVDECEQGLVECDAGAPCQNLPGGYVCGVCPPGYVSAGNGNCQDVDECLDDSAGCAERTTCINEVGSYRCGPCPAGYSGDGSEGCVDLNECELDHGGCDPLAECTNRLGTVECGACPAGYQGDGSAGCADIDECAANHGGCDPLVSCTNEPGSYRCGDCPDGYTGNGEQGCLPTLTSLVPLAGGLVLEPAFDPTQQQYQGYSPAVGEPLLRVELTYSADAELWFDGQPVAGELQGTVRRAVVEHRWLAGSNGLHLAVVAPRSGARRDYELLLERAAALTPAAYIKAPNADAGDGFGRTVAMAGPWLAVGAPGEDGAGPNPADNSAADAGAVYVYRRGADGQYALHAYVKREPGAALNDQDWEGDQFGSALALDERYLVVGAPGEDQARGSAYVFELAADGVRQVARLGRLAGLAGDHYGASVALRGVHLLIGAPGADGGAGRAALWTRLDTSWSLLQGEWSPNENPGNNAFGRHVALNELDALVVGDGAAETWQLQGPVRESRLLTPGPRALAFLAGDLLVGYGFGAQKFLRFEDSWSSASAALTPPGISAADGYGSAVATAMEGRLLVMGAPGDDSAATQVDGDANNAGASGAGAVYVYRDLSFERLGYLKAFNARAGAAFGAAVAAADYVIAVGAPGEAGALAGVYPMSAAIELGTEVAEAAGAVYLFQ